MKSSISLSSRLLSSLKSLRELTNSHRCDGPKVTKAFLVKWAACTTALNGACLTVGNSTAGPQNTHPSDPPTQEVPQRTESRTPAGNCTPVFTAALLAAARCGSNPSVRQQVSGEAQRGLPTWQTHPRKEGKSVTPAATRVNPEGVMRSAISQIQQEKYCDSTGFRSLK